MSIQFYFIISKYKLPEADVTYVKLCYNFTFVKLTSWKFISLIKGINFLIEVSCIRKISFRKGSDLNFYAFLIMYL